MMKKIILSLFSIFVLFFLIAETQSQSVNVGTSVGIATVWLTPPTSTTGVSASFVIVALSIALSALVFAVKRGKDKYEEE